MPSIVFLQLLNVIGLAIAHHPSTGYHLGPGEESHTTGGNKSGPLWPWQIFQSAPYNPPELEISSNGAPLGDGLLLFTPGNFRPDVPYAKQSSAVIMTDAGQLVWNGPTGGTNLRTAAYKGSPILTYWTGATTAGGNAGHGYGNVTLLNNKYEKIITVCPKLGLVVPKGDPVHPCEADLHEAFITDRDTLVISAYNATPADLSTVGGPKSGWVFDCLVVEIEPESGEILFRWSAFEHVPVSESQYPLLGAGNESVPFDYFHINSITTIGDSFLVNARHTWSTYLVSASGNVEWTLQGETGGDFGSLPEQGRFVSGSVPPANFQWSNRPPNHFI